MLKSIPILLVEDNEIDTEVVKRILKKANITNSIYTAVDGVDAIDILQGQNNGTEAIPSPCLILLDINMPRMDGFEFLESIRHNKDMKNNIVFMLTTSERDEDIAKAYDLNAAGYILKENIQTLPNFIQDYCQINQFPQNLQ